MKKLAFIALLLGLTACQAPYTHTVYQATGPRICTEYFDSFRCSSPTRTWHETVYPKNNIQMDWVQPVYIPYQSPQSLSQVVYGTSMYGSNK